MKTKISSCTAQQFRATETRKKGKLEQNFKKESYFYNAKFKKTFLGIKLLNKCSRFKDVQKIISLHPNVHYTVFMHLTNCMKNMFLYFRIIKHNKINSLQYICLCNTVFCILYFFPKRNSRVQMVPLPPLPPSISGDPRVSPLLDPTSTHPHQTQ